MDVLARLDRYQRRHRWAGVPLAVVYKFFDDQATYLAALLTYYGFVSLFPLLLLLVAILSGALHGNPRLQHSEDLRPLRRASAACHRRQRPSLTRGRSHGTRRCAGVVRSPAERHARAAPRAAAHAAVRAVLPGPTGR
ncbi:hypothetical protein [Streptomyces sp. NPDC002386]